MPELPVDVSMTLVGFSVQVMPGGETVSVKETVPVKPPIEDTVTVEVPVPPVLTLTEVGLAVIEKSITENVSVTVAVCDNDPLAPVIVTV